MLLSRDLERQQIDQALAKARSGTSATLALVGEPGIGKTALLGYAAEHAAGMQLLRARGIESEAQIPFGSLLELIRPALVMLDTIPRPQAAALESALALRPGTAHDRFAVGAGTLRLLAAYAEQVPVTVLVDDAQWLDGSSAQALLFAFRRLLADPVAVLIAVREGEPSLLDGTDLPALRIGGLTSDEAATLVRELAPETARRLHRATAGNPLALLELAPDAHNLALAPEGAPVLVSTRISRAFLQRAGLLDQATRQAWSCPRPATLVTCRRSSALRPGSGSIFGCWPPRRARGWSHWTRVRSNSAIRWPGRRSTPMHPPASAVLRTGRSRHPCPTGTSTAGPGISPPPRGRHGRKRVGGAGAGRRPRAGPQRIRDRGRGVRARRAAHHQRRAACAAAARGGRDRLAGRLHRPRDCSAPRGAGLGQ